MSPTLFNDSRPSVPVNRESINVEETAVPRTGKDLDAKEILGVVFNEPLSTALARKGDASATGDSLAADRAFDGHTHAADEARTAMAEATRNIATLALMRDVARLESAGELE